MPAGTGLGQSGGGGGMTPSELARLEYLEDNEYKVTYWASVSSNSGAVTKPTGSTIILDGFMSGVDAVVETIVNGQPSGLSPVTAGGAYVTVSSFDTSGNYTLSGTPSATPVALLYIVTIPGDQYQNLDNTKVITAEPTKVAFGTTAGTAAEGNDGRFYGTAMYAVASGTDTYTASVTPALTLYATGQQFRIKIPNLNTVTNPTLNINSLGAKTIKAVNGAAIPIGQFYANGDYLFVYDGTDFILQAGIMDRKDLSYFRKTGTTTYERWYSTNFTNAALTTNPSLAKDVIRAIPFIVSKTTTLDRIGMEITAAGTAASVLRLGIYDDVNGVPTNLILDAGTIAADSATAQTITISQVLTPGLYYLTFVHNSTATITVRAHFAYTHPQVCGFNATWNLTQNAGAIAATFTYGTLPSTFPTTAISPITGSVVPAIFVRLSA